MGNQIMKKMFSTKVRNDLLKEFKKLAIDLERPINDVLEEAIRDLLDKYGVRFDLRGSGPNNLGSLAGGQSGGEKTASRRNKIR